MLVSSLSSEQSFYIRQVLVELTVLFVLAMGWAFLANFVLVFGITREG